MIEQPNLPIAGSGDNPPVDGHSISAKVELMAEWLDGQSRPHDPIMVVSSRATLLRRFRPKLRGGTLYCGSHPLILRGPVSVSGVSVLAPPAPQSLWRETLRRWGIA